MSGLVSAPDFLDVYTLGSPWVHFQSLAFTTGAGTISLPGDAALGVIAGGWLNENLYILGGFEDANSVASDFFKSFDTFFSEKEFFKHIEIGWTTSTERAYLDNVHLTLWHADERDKADTHSGHGTIFSFTKYIDEKWMPFFRAGYAKDGASFLERSVSAGVAYQPNPIGASAGSLLGIGLNWGKPNETVYGQGVGNQNAFELFYRLQVTEQLAITPGIQYLRNPALNPDERSIWVFDLRARFSLKTIAERFHMGDRHPEEAVNRDKQEQWNMELETEKPAYMIASVNVDEPEKMGRTWMHRAPCSLRQA